MNARHDTDRGFTLVELLIAIVLSGVIAGVTVAAMITSLNVASSTTAQVNDSADAGQISAFLARDAQSAGATDATTALPDASLGVSTAASTAGWAGCAQAAAMVVRFSWMDRASASVQTRVVVTYALDGAGLLTRRTCQNGTTADVVLGRHVTSATASCQPVAACTGRPATVSLALQGAGTRAPLAYTLTASMRNDLQVAPTASNSSPVAVVALGAPLTAATCPNLTLSGTGKITVVGSAVIDATCGSAPIAGDQTVLRPTGSTGSMVGLIDPFVGRVAPNGACAAGGTNPAIIGVSGGVDAVVVYPQAVSITASLVFQPGRYIFCAGLSITGGTVTGANVLFYVAGGTLAIGSGATVDLAASTTGSDSNLLIWVATAQTITIDGGPRVNAFRGLVYAPSSTLQLSSSLAANVGGLVAKNIVLKGAGAMRVGLPMPVLSISPATIAAGQVGVTYAATLIGTGGTSPSTWSATGLPDGLTINAASGTIAGMPTVAGQFAVVVTSVDATAAAESIDYGLTIAPRLAIASPASLPSGQVGVVYASTTVAASGGTTPYSWSATGLPAGLSINATTGAISGQPSLAGSYTVTVTVTDAMAATASAAYTVGINAVLAVAGPSTLPSGQAGVAYVPTTMSSSGGTATYSWSATGLPAGLSINASTGVISGTPTASGSLAVMVKVTDATTAAAQRVYTLTIATAVVVPPGCGDTATGWRGEYFSNVSLAAPATLCRDDVSINLDWGNGAPATGMPADNFSVRWTKTVTFAAGNYTFTLGSDDGARLYVDGVLILDRWVDQGYPSPVPTAAVALADGGHTVVVEYYERSGLARATLAWVASAPPSCSVAATGWLGQYYNNATLTGLPVLCRDDAAINFDWGSGAAAQGMPTENFSVRWTRAQSFAAGTYTFALGTDDGGRLYVDGVLILDRWVDQSYPSPQPSVNKALTAGSHTLVVEYYERGGDARATLSTSSASNGVTVVDSSAGDRRYYGESIISLSNTSAITAMTVTVNVVKTTGLTYYGQYTDVASGAITSAHPTTSGVLRYTFDLAAGRTIAAGTWKLDAQWSGTGVLHSTTGDTWTVVTTSNGITSTLTGTF